MNTPPVLHFIPIIVVWHQSMNSLHYVPVICTGWFKSTLYCQCKWTQSGGWHPLEEWSKCKPSCNSEFELLYRCMYILLRFYTVIDTLKIYIHHWFIIYNSSVVILLSGPAHTHLNVAWAKFLRALTFESLPSHAPNVRRHLHKHSPITDARTFDTPSRPDREGVAWRDDAL